MLGNGSLRLAPKPYDKYREAGRAEGERPSDIQATREKGAKMAEDVFVDEAMRAAGESLSPPLPIRRGAALPGDGQQPA